MSCERYTYNVQGTQNMLNESQKWIDEDKQYPHAFVKLPSGWENSYELTYHPNPSSWRLIRRQSSEEEKQESEEVIFSMQGIIDSKNLPPILEDPKIPRNKAHFLQQSVTLTGLGSSAFEEHLSAIQEMYTAFGRQFPEGRVMVWQPGSSTLGPGRNVVLSNRYFIKKSEGQQMQGVPFSSNVDPKKILTRMLSSSLIHTEENEVQYFSRHGDLGGNFKYSTANPQNFRVGDIVEVQFSLVFYKMRSEHYVLKPMLYSIALLEGKFANDLAKMQTLAVTSPIECPLKRKIGYVVDFNQVEQKAVTEQPQKRNKSCMHEEIEQMEGIAKMSIG